MVPTLYRSTISPEHTAALGAGFADLLLPGDCVALRAELGAGKTTFVRAVARGLGVDEREVSSPTFVFVNQYPFAGPNGQRCQIIHVDAYRMNSGEDLESLGWDALFDPHERRPYREGHGAGIALVEWPDRIADALPTELATIRIRHGDDPDQRPDERHFEFEIPAAWTSRPAFESFAGNEPVRCRITDRWVSPTSRSYPFIDERSKLADLNRWFTGQYSISRRMEPDDSEELGDQRVERER